MGYDFTWQSAIALRFGLRGKFKTSHRNLGLAPVEIQLPKGFMQRIQMTCSVSIR